MTNKELNNIDVLWELESSFEKKQNDINFDNIETINIPEEYNILKSSSKNIDILETIEKSDSLVIKKKNAFFSSVIFITKYLLTSSLIFLVLLVATNYSAYINIAKSYIFKSELQASSQKLISSVEAWNIKEKYSEEKIMKLEQSEQSDKLSIKQMKKEQDKKNINLNIEITPYENRIIIPKIGKNIPLVDIQNRNIDWAKELNDIFMKELENGVIRYPWSAKPGEDGSSFIFGHSSNFPWIKWDYNDVFSLLDKVSYDDEIIVYYNQEKYIYKIREKKVITPWDVSVLERNKNKSEITLMTCRPIWTTLNRLIVVWDLVKVNNKKM